jgi:hypothetical protein
MRPGPQRSLETAVGLAGGTDAAGRLDVPDPDGAAEMFSGLVLGHGHLRAMLNVPQIDDADERDGRAERPHGSSSRPMRPAIFALGETGRVRSSPMLIHLSSWPEIDARLNADRPAVQDGGRADRLQRAARADGPPGHRLAVPRDHRPRGENGPTIP